MVDFTALAAPFLPTQISWRIGPTSGDKKSGIALAYLDSRDVQDRLDMVCGPGGWQDRYPHVGQKTVCEIIILCGDTWVTKSDGAGDTDMEAEKGALSDAFKRAAVKWGIGRYLYSLPNVWVEIEPAGRSFKIKKGETPKLIASLERHMKGLPPPPDIVAEAHEISQQQATEARQNGKTPPRKANPSRKEWVDYAADDFQYMTAPEQINLWFTENAAKVAQLEDQNHSLWVYLNEAADAKRDALRSPL